MPVVKLVWDKFFGWPGAAAVALAVSCCYFGLVKRSTIRANRLRFVRDRRVGRSVLANVVPIVLFTFIAQAAPAPAEAAVLGLNGPIAFESDRDGNSEIYVMNADGTNQTNLTHNPAPDFEPVFSPDGTRIAFSSYRDGNPEIYVMRADGTNQTRLTNSGYDVQPVFSPTVPASPSKAVMTGALRSM